MLSHLMIRHLMLSCLWYRIAFRYFGRKSPCVILSSGGAILFAPGTRTILASAAEVSLAKLAEMADKIADHSVPAVSLTAQSQPGSLFSSFEAKLCPNIRV